MAGGEDDEDCMLNDEIIMEIEDERLHLKQSHNIDTTDIFKPVIKIYKEVGKLNDAIKELYYKLRNMIPHKNLPPVQCMPLLPQMVESMSEVKVEYKRKNIEEKNEDKLPKKRKKLRQDKDSEDDDDDDDDKLPKMRKKLRQDEDSEDDDDEPPKKRKKLKKKKLSLDQVQCDMKASYSNKKEDELKEIQSENTLEHNSPEEIIKIIEKCV